MSKIGKIDRVEFASEPAELDELVVAYHGINRAIILLNGDLSEEARLTLDAQSAEVTDMIEDHIIGNPGILGDLRQDHVQRVNSAAEAINSIFILKEGDVSPVYLSSRNDAIRYGALVVDAIDFLKHNEPHNPILQRGFEQRKAELGDYGPGAHIEFHRDNEITIDGHAIKLSAVQRAIIDFAIDAEGVFTHKDVYKSPSFKAAMESQNVGSPPHVAIVNNIRQLEAKFRRVGLPLSSLLARGEKKSGQLERNPNTTINDYTIYAHDPEQTHKLASDFILDMADDNTPFSIHEILSAHTEVDMRLPRYKFFVDRVRADVTTHFKGTARTINFLPDGRLIIQTATGQTEHVRKQQQPVKEIRFDSITHENGSITRLDRAQQLILTTLIEKKSSGASRAHLLNECKGRGISAEDFESSFRSLSASLGSSLQKLEPSRGNPKARYKIDRSKLTR